MLSVSCADSSPTRTWRPASAASTGGNRFRPCIEDVIEFLITVRLVEAHDGWGQRVEEGRVRYRRGQLKAAMRRHPDVVEEYLRDRQRKEKRD
ncbi:hypothetical protein [Streptomyces rhizosphaericus]|uniref:hypothetical protein n=1 Tax=Streptomyces rhizosphaericus TaxID=114699 RepID=UPI000A3D57ED|nr:hypothetical protein [Streptomyces rhizosphaericus]